MLTTGPASKREDRRLFGTYTAGGSCLINNNCIQSPNYPSYYNNDDYCVFTVDGSYYLSATAFSLESNYDFLYINGASFTGSTAFPSGLAVFAGDQIIFDSDYSIPYRGFEVCFHTTGFTLSPTPAGPTHAPVVASFKSESLRISISSGLCTFSGNCIRSPNYPSNYNADDYCAFTVGDHYSLTATSFELETCCDSLTIGGLPFTGTEFPSGLTVKPNDSIVFDSDVAVQYGGFEVCFHSRGGSRSNVVSSQIGASIFYILVCASFVCGLGLIALTRKPCQPMVSQVMPVDEDEAHQGITMAASDTFSQLNTAVPLGQLDVSAVQSNLSATVTEAPAAIATEVTEVLVSRPILTSLPDFNNSPAIVTAVVVGENSESLSSSNNNNNNSIHVVGTVVSTN
jgi:hypothetical protein